MKKKLVLFLVLLSYTFSGITQHSCQKDYSDISDMYNEARNLFRETEYPILEKVARSQELVRQALGLAYAAIRAQDCTAYSNIVDQIIDLELMIDDPMSAKKIALERLNRLHPNWKKWEQAVNIRPDYLSVLSRIDSYRSDNNFYIQMVDGQGIVYVCGTVSYPTEIRYLSEHINSVCNNLGKKLCLRYLENKILVVHDEDEHAAESWEAIYTLLIESLSTQYSHEELIHLYKKATIQQVPKHSITYIGGYNIRGKYYVQIANVKLYFKSYMKREKDGKNRSEQYLVDPENLEEIKENSHFYLKLREMAS